MKKIEARVHSVHRGPSDQLGKDELASIVVELDGIVGDRHRSFSRRSWGAGDKQPEGTVRRNERQWSAMSMEELAEISEAMDLVEPLTAAALGANICLQGIDDLSRLPKGTTLKFPSGAELMIEEFNHPCLDMGAKLAATFKTRSGDALQDTTFSKAAKLTRGVVGTVEVAGIINKGDAVEIAPYEHPPWLSRSG